MQGDELQNIYHNLIPINFIIGSIFAYSYIWFSINCIQNAYLAQIEDSYVKQSKKSIFSWLQDDLDDPDKKNMLYASDSDDEPEFKCEEFLRSLKRTQLI